MTKIISTWWSIFEVGKNFRSVDVWGKFQHMQFHFQTNSTLGVCTIIKY